MKKILISALFATTCLSAPALAQTTPQTTTGDTATTAPAVSTTTTPATSSDTATTPAASSDTTTTTTPATTTTDTTTAPAAGTAAETQTMGAGGGMQNEGGFITYQEGNQVLGSGLMGANVRGSNGENIGTVDDLLLDRDGQVMAVIVGVGGFLGIGEKDVAISNDQLQFVLVQEAAAADQAAAGAAGTAAAPAGTAPVTGGAAATVDPAAPAGTAPVTGAVPADGTAPAAGGTAMAPAGGTAAGTGMTATDGTAMPGTNPGAANNGFGWTGAGIDHIQVNFTRQQLEDAPAFESAE